jgi:hypothetical protein
VLPTFVKQMTVRDTAPPVPTVAAHPVVPRSVVDRGATIRGNALWWSGVDLNHRWWKHIWKVEFYVDGKLLYTDHSWPYSFHRTAGWNTRSVANGKHMLTVVEFGTHHYRVRKHLPVVVKNPPMHVRVAGAVNGGAVYGLLHLSATVNVSAQRVVLYADGKPVSRDDRAPFALTWDTRTQAEGEHELVVYARDAHGHRAALQLPVMVANAPTFPASLSRNWVTHHLNDSFVLAGD